LTCLHQGHVILTALQIKGLSLNLQNRDKVIQTVKSDLQDVTHVWYAIAFHANHMFMHTRECQEDDQRISLQDLPL
jgi:trans-2-enoyl-CoA reductase